MNIVPSVVDELVGAFTLQDRLAKAAKVYLAERDRQRAAIDRLVRDRVERDTVLERAIAAYPNSPSALRTGQSFAELLHGAK
jgi:hypothetical protein